MTIIFIAFTFFSLLAFVCFIVIGLRSGNILAKMVMFVLSMADGAFFVLITIATFWPNLIPV